jgi:dUTP pyrophosphatase
MAASPRTALNFQTQIHRYPVTVRVFNQSENPLPEYKTAGAAACDVCANAAFLISPGETAKIPTGLFVEIPAGWKISVLPRSGLSAKGISVTNSPGTIDEDYRGEISVLLTNHSQLSFQVSAGDRIGQLEIVPVFKIQWQPVESVKELGSTDRGAGGFGSTGPTSKIV